jgi:hypothetical protein
VFVDKDLQEYLETSSVINHKNLVVAEWNMNFASNIQKIGNYRYRPGDAASQYNRIASNYQDIDTANNYTNATDADILVDGGFQSALDPVDQTVQLFPKTSDQYKMYYSLEDCFGKFRPRSGINKTLFFGGKQLGFSHPTMAQRPRYYPSDKNDQFKYWTSYRTEESIERGVSYLKGGLNYIDDAAPFVIYKDPVPTNRIILKMQTNVGSVDLGPFSNSSGNTQDGFFGYENQTTPTRWKIQYLFADSWNDVISFDEGSLRNDGSQIIGPDGYVEVGYGITNIPTNFRSRFRIIKEITSDLLLPATTSHGNAYLVKTTPESIGTIHVYDAVESEYVDFIPNYGWFLLQGDSVIDYQLVTELVDKPSYDGSLVYGQSKGYREFQYIQGLRVVVETMNTIDSTFDLIELSPRLAVDLSDKTEAFGIVKAAADLSSSSLPVGQLLVSTGNLTVFDYDLAFNVNNKESIVSDYIYNHIQFKFYDVVDNVDGIDYFIPIKTLYSEGFPQSSSKDRTVSLELRDLFFYFESLLAPQILLVDVSLSYAISMLLDSIGFSNYSFKRSRDEKEAIIPFFFIDPDRAVSEILNDLAIATQSAMFFDEYNNFIVMSKEYLLPSTNERDSEVITLYGTADFEQDGAYTNANIDDDGNTSTKPRLANIMEISSSDNNVYNDGTIFYVARSIQRSVSSIQQAATPGSRDDSFVYRVSDIWEVQPDDSVGPNQNKAPGYSLVAYPLNSNLTQSPPSVVNHALVDNIIDLGEGAFLMAKFNGFFYANGEVIKYDAVEYSVPGVEKFVRSSTSNAGQVQTSVTLSGGLGNVWVSSKDELIQYFSDLTFNGKIYPTGRIRIYAEPNYEEVNGVLRLQNGPVAKHGRGQFNTQPVSHTAGLNPYWSSNTNVRGCDMNSRYLFEGTIPSGVSEGAAGLTLISDPTVSSNTFATKSSRNGIIKNYLNNVYLTESEVGNLQSAKPGTIQSSALVFSGPAFTSAQSPNNFLSYVHKPLENKFRHFGTRMRLIGRAENSATNSQTGVGASTYYLSNSILSNETISISGTSGGLAVMLNPETNNGYYFEIAALSALPISSSEDEDAQEYLANVMFYKIMKEDSTGQAVPVTLFSGKSSINVSSGNFAGQGRLLAEDFETVYDLSVEYLDVGSTRKFFLYINSVLIATVIDEKPLRIFNNMALFVRGATKAMFENIFAITNNYSQNTSNTFDTPIAEVFSSQKINADAAFNKYALSGMVQESYLSGISSATPPKYDIYFEEFGTIMREAAYFDVRYDKAYPALVAMLTPSYNKLKGYVVSEFIAGAYSAEFLLFNITDTIINIAGSEQNNLSISGITFTSESENTFSVDDYFNNKHKINLDAFSKNVSITSPQKVKKDYQDIVNSRISYGKNAFAITSPYIQSQAQAQDLMGWIVNKIMKPRKSIGMSVFGMPTLQLGDLVSIKYKTKEGVDELGPEDGKFVVYYIEYAKDSQGPLVNIFLSEV